MNRKKINNMILALGTAAALSLGGNIQAKAVENNTVSVSYKAKVSLASASNSQIEEAVNNVNTNGGNVQDYNIIVGSMKVNIDNFQDVKEAVSIMKERKQRNLTKDEIKKTVVEAAGVSLLFQAINEETMSASDYFDVGIENVNDDNVDGFNTLLRNKKYYFIEDLQNYIDSINSSIDKINKGNGEVQDYKNIEINVEVTEENKDVINRIAKTAFVKKGTSLTIKDIEEIAESGAVNYTLLSAINEGNAVLDIYNKLNITSVEEDNILFINENIKGKNLWIVSEIQDEVNKLADIFKNFSKLKKGTADIADFKSFGIDGVTSENIIYVNADLKGKDFLTVQEVEDYVNKNLSIYMALSKVNKGLSSLEDYSVLGCNLVSSTNIDFINTKLKNCNILTISEMQKAVKSKVEAKESIDKIVAGEASLGDYERINAIGVNSDNLDYVNKAIKGKVNDYGTNIQLVLNDILGSYGILNNINEGKETKDENAFVKEYKDLLNLEIAYDTTADSEFSIIRSCIKIKRKLLSSRQLSKEEISEIINLVHSNLEDSKVVIAKINEEVEKAEAVYERELTSKEEDDLINSVISKIKYAVRRIYVGAAKVEDFKLFGENRVNEYNISVVNKDIESYNEMSRLSAYRLSGITEEVDKALAVYNINRDNLNKDQNGLVKEFVLLGKEVPYDYQNGSLLRITEDLIIIRKKENGGEILGRKEILSVLDEVENNLSKYKVLVPKIVDKIFLDENSKNRELTKDEVNEIVNKVEEDTKNTVSRLVLGEGKVEDYILYGENRVNSSNLSVVNEYIKVYGEVSKTSNYDVSGLKEAVDKGLAIYDLNNGIETASLNGRVKELETIGVIVESSNDSNSIDKKVMNKIKEKRASENNRYLNKDDILKIVAEAKTSQAAKEPEEPKKKPGFFDSIKDWFKHVFKF